MRLIDSWLVPRFGEPADVLERATRELPDPKATTVVVEVDAIGLNFLDVSVCRGQYTSDPQPPVVPGAEVAGRVRAIGAGVTEVAIGDRVCAMSPSAQGGFASALAVPQGAVCRIPEDMPVDLGAGLMVTYHTAFVSLIRRAGLVAGDCVLIHSGSGGTGSAAIQLAVGQGARVIATARSDEKAAACLALGAEVAVNTEKASFVDAVMDLTSGRGADIILDPVGGETFRQSLECVAFEGRVVPIGWVSGVPAQFEAAELLTRNITLIGVAWGMAYPLQRPDVVQETHEQIVEAYRTGIVRSVVSRRWSFAELPQAVQALADGQVIGKAVVRLDAEPWT